MTTQTYTSVVDHTSDAGFRAWGSELNTNLAAAGLVVTADTGQVNWTTVTRPAVSTVGGYEIWRFADSSLYVKMEYGTGGSANYPQMWITVGTGSNGSGTITAQTNTRAIWTVGVAPNSTATVYTTYISRTADALAIAWKMNGAAGTAVLGLLVVGKTVDSAGAATTTGFGVLRTSTISGGVPSFQSVRTAATAVTYGDTNQGFTCIPGNPSSSTVGADIQAYLLWMNVPQVVPFAWAAVYLVAEVTKVNTVSGLAMVSTPTHTYLALGQLGSSSTINGQAAATYSFLMIYE